MEAEIILRGSHVFVTIKEPKKVAKRVCVWKDQKPTITYACPGGRRMIRWNMQRAAYNRLIAHARMLLVEAGEIEWADKCVEVI